MLENGRWEGLTRKTTSSLADSLGRPELLAENFAYIAQILFRVPMLGPFPSNICTLKHPFGISVAIGACDRKEIPPVSSWAPEGVSG